MKTSININLFGTVYAIDEDAHQLLKQYLDNMKSYFSKQQGGEEIADDIEHRVAELFWDMKQQGTESINIDQVREIIGKIGNPEQMDDKAETEAENNEGKANECNGQNAEAEGNKANANGDNAAKNSTFAEAKAEFSAEGAKSWIKQRRYYRDPKDKLIGGVIAGATKYFGGGDPLVWRIAMILLFFLLNDWGEYIIGLYLLFWMIAPEAKTAEDRLRMQGKEVNPDSIKSEVLGSQNADSQPVQHSQPRGCLMSIVGFLAGCFKALLIFMGIIMFISLVIPIFAIIVTLFNANMLFNISGIDTNVIQFLADDKWMIISGLIGIIVIIALPIYAIYRWLRSNNVKPLSQLTKSVLIILWIAALFFCTYDAIHLGINATDGHYNIDWNQLGMAENEDDEDADEITRTDQIDPFQSIHVQGIGDVHFTQSDSCTCRVKGSEKLTGNTYLNVVNGELTISQPEGISLPSNQYIDIYLTAPSLDAIVMEGVGKIEIEDTLHQELPIALTLKGVGKLEAEHIDCPIIDIAQEGIGRMQLDVKADRLHIRNTGVGKIKLSGTTNYYKTMGTLTGKIDLDDLEIKKTL